MVIVSTKTLFINQNQEKMKKAKQILSAVTLTAFLVFTSPVVMAQTTENTTTTRTADDEDVDGDDDNEGKWGLAGLLGLLGLLGLKRRDDDHTNKTVNR